MCTRLILFNRIDLGDETGIWLKHIDNHVIFDSKSRGSKSALKILQSSCVASGMPESLELTVVVQRVKTLNWF